DKPTARELITVRGEERLEVGKKLADYKAEKKEEARLKKLEREYNLEATKNIERWRRGKITKKELFSLYPEIKDRWREIQKWADQQMKIMESKSMTPAQKEKAGLMGSVLGKGELQQQTNQLPAQGIAPGQQTRPGGLSDVMGFSPGTLKEARTELSKEAREATAKLKKGVKRTLGEGKHAFGNEQLDESGNIIWKQTSATYPPRPFKETGQVTVSQERNWKFKMQTQKYNLKKIELEGRQDNAEAASLFLDEFLFNIKEVR
ncbi:MAG: hypothetical protein KAS04_03055, partial [Candidatus Aenigmarchaeota archaeon]|nr:hypothetical protein [Candidatus Aenigmarchaeota archaeon]